MQFFVKFEAFYTLTGEASVMHLRQAFKEQAQVVMRSGRMKAGGMFTDQRGGFMLLEVSSPEELYELLGGAMLDHFHLETHPVAGFEDLFDFFKKQGVR